MLDPALRPEYERQVRDQQDGLNAMTVDQWEQNRTEFTASGRHEDDARMRSLYGSRTPKPKGSAAPHNPDGVAGGFKDPTGPPAVAAVNSHLGSNWNARIPVIEAALAGLTPPDKLVTQMNVVLSV
jgi:hypothetical protein